MLLLYSWKIMSSKQIIPPRNTQEQRRKKNRAKRTQKRKQLQREDAKQQRIQYIKKMTNKQRKRKRQANTFLYGDGKHEHHSWKTLPEYIKMKIYKNYIGLHWGKNALEDYKLLMKTMHERISIEFNPINHHLDMKTGKYVDCHHIYHNSIFANNRCFINSTYSTCQGFKKEAELLKKHIMLTHGKTHKRSDNCSEKCCFGIKYLFR